MTVIEVGAQWFVVGTLIGPFASNAVAWRYVDKLNGKPVSRPDNVQLELWNAVPAVSGKKGEDR